jgi:Bcr/CflA subfamily drug resistance transporter
MKSLPYIIFISVLFTSIGQVASDLYLPSLPAITVSLQTTVHMAQATVFIFMVGFSVSRLIYGPISDGFGRRIPLITGIILCLCGTTICACATSINILLFGRLLQGIGSGAGLVVSRAIIRDLLHGYDLAKAYSYVSIANIAMIASAPLLGGFIQVLFGWRANFIVILLFALTALLVSTFFLKETNKHKTIENLKPRKIKINLIALFSNRPYVIYGLSVFMVYGAILAWLTLGPVLLQNTLGLSPTDFGWVSLIGGIFYAGGSFINGRLVNKYGINNMSLTGACFILGSGMLILFFWLLNAINIWTLVTTLAFFFFGDSLIFPNAVAGALIPFAKIAGIAGAVLGFLSILGGAVASGIVTLLPDNTPLPMAIAFIVCGLGVWLAIRFGLHEKKREQ